MPKKSDRLQAVMAWSCGKDGALALHRSFQRGDYEVLSLMTTVGEKIGRISVNGVREDLLDKQVRATGLPLVKIPLPIPCPHQVYEKRWEEALAPWKAKGVRHVLFADVKGDDIRRSREEMLSKIGMEAVFPLWGESTRALSQEILNSGFGSLIVSVDTKKLPASLAGKFYDSAFLKNLPPGIDPCGENGEFHTFVFQAPFFKKQIGVKVGEGVSQLGFHFADLQAK
jgi:uncharacterized protein (TIGR00290 family)